jgi:hypothetical protein
MSYAPPIDRSREKSADPEHGARLYYQLPEPFEEHVRVCKTAAGVAPGNKRTAMQMLDLSIG